MIRLDIRIMEGKMAFGISSSNSKCFKKFLVMQYEISFRDANSQRDISLQT